MLKPFLLLCLICSSSLILPNKLIASTDLKKCSTLWRKALPSASHKRWTALLSPVYKTTEAWRASSLFIRTQTLFKKLTSLIDPVDSPFNTPSRKIQKILRKIEANPKLKKSLHDLIVSKLSSSLPSIEGRNGKLHLITIYNHIFSENSSIANMNPKILKQAEAAMHHMDSDEAKYTLFKQLYQNGFFTRPDSNLSSRDKIIFFNPLLTQNPDNKKLHTSIFAILPELTKTEVLEIIKVMLLPQQSQPPYYRDLQHNALILLQLILFHKSPIRTKPIDLHAVLFIGNMFEGLNINRDNPYILINSILDNPAIAKNPLLQDSEEKISKKQINSLELSEKDYLSLVSILQRGLLHKDQSISLFSLKILHSLTDLGIIHDIHNIVSPSILTTLKNNTSNEDTRKYIQQLMIAFEENQK